MYRYRYFSIAIVLVALTSSVLAQQPAPQSTHEAAARELLQVIGVARTAAAGAESMMGAVRNNPELAPFEDVVRAWYKKVFAEGDLEGEIAAVYMKHFSEDEIRGLTAFYKSALGQKALETLPLVMKEGADIGMRRGKEHSSELEQMIEKARKERAQKGKERS